MGGRQFLIRQIQRLTIALIVSGSLNIALITYVVWWLVKERPPTPYFEHRPAEHVQPLAIDRSNAEVLRYLAKLPREQLFGKLKDNRLVENGYTQRDLALGVLVAHHHFDLQRSLGDLPLPADKRTIAYGPQPHEVITLYPSIKEKHYDAIIGFAATEVWPLTPKGMFLTLKNKQPQSLKEAFFLTPEFQAVHRLFSRADVHVKKQELLNMLLEDQWQPLEQFAEQQRSAQDLSDTRRRAFLLEYIRRGSKTAARLMIDNDSEFAAARLNDESVIALLQLLDQRTAAAMKFALKSLTSPRSEQVWREAARKLYSFSGEPVPEGLERQTALSRFAPLSGSQEAPPKALPAKISDTPKSAVQSWKRAYLVQDGDSLWKISRRFKVDIDELRSRNNLSNDTLQPGTLLSIP